MSVKDDRPITMGRIEVNGIDDGRGEGEGWVVSHVCLSVRVRVCRNRLV